jgi:hypothetical protein
MWLAKVVCRLTLILTEISVFGIAMAADSAVTEEVVTPNGTREYRVLTGVHKLQVIKKLKAGMYLAHEIDPPIFGAFSVK